MKNVVNMKSVLRSVVYENLNALICRMKNTLTKNTNVNWDCNFWMLHNKEVRFTKLSYKKGTRSNIIMDDKFLGFAKSYMVHECIYNERKIKQSISALRILESTLIKINGDCDISKININVLNESIYALKNRLDHNKAYAIGNSLMQVVSFIVDNNLTTKNIFSWRNPLRDERDYFVYDGKGIHKDKLPDEIALNAFAEVFSRALTDKRDIFTTSIIVLLMSAPSRISEVFSLPVDCEIQQITRYGDVKHGLRFWAGKGYGGDIKWIPTVMAPITKIAIERILSITHDARAFSKMMELDFNSFCKSKGHTENQLLTAVQVIKIISNQNHSKENCVKILNRLSLKSMDYSYSLQSLWTELRKRLPPNFPWYDKLKNIKYSNLLFLFFKDAFHPRKSDNIIQLCSVNSTAFYSGFSNDEKKSNFFKRHGYKKTDGSTIRFNSHQIRHLLNTLAQRQGLTDEEIAKWSGRVNVKQNRVYNHISEEEILEKYESLKEQSERFIITEKGDYKDKTYIHGAIPISGNSMHITEFGYCTHDYVISSCEKFRDCINCSEQLCIKGNSENLTRLKSRLVEISKFIDKVSDKMNGDILQMKNDQWLMIHARTKERLVELIGILENERIPDGSYIRLDSTNFTHLSRITGEQRPLKRNMENLNVKKTN
ncbi:TPA: hypothetical protein N3A47_002206 [Salmonella enterica subsp. houtenae serovar 47:z36:-]|nr:hypothetical protein HPG92_17330 [Salmonella enterica]HCM1976824.1 hypothetical protein [Salmonella enterica subsp. houtenae serovar 47:z36:-]